MTDVTEVVLRYRHILLNVWNTHIWGDPNLRDVAIIDAFERLKKPLFQFFVWDQLAQGEPMPKQVFGPRFKAVPAKQATFAPS